MEESRPAVLPLTLLVEGETATGLLGVPGGRPHALVVIAHGGGTTAEHHREDLQGLAEDGVLAVAMDYRGARDAFKVEAGVQDTVAATLFLQAAYPEVRQTILQGWSMGGAVALLAVATAPAGTYAHVVVGSGITDLAALWQELPWVRPAIESEAGGTPDAAPQAYAERSPIHHAAAIVGRAERIWFVHGADDPIVKPSHAYQMHEALLAAGQPVAYYEAVRTTWAACMPSTPCIDPVTQAAGHEAGQFLVLRPLVAALLAGEPIAMPALDVRGSYDVATGTPRAPPPGR